MSNALSRRLLVLETLANPKAPSLLLFLMRRAGTEKTGEDDKITGIRADGSRLPALERLHGETVDGLTQRAKGMITGGGVTVIRYARDPAPMLH